MTPKQDYVWHGHHENDCPLELLKGTIEARQQDIRTNKPKHEHKTRLHLLALASMRAITLFKKYEKVRGPALAEYEKVCDLALAEYEKVRGLAWAEYEKVCDLALAEYEKVRGPAWAEYEKVRGPALAEYKKVRGLAWAEYEKVHGLAWAEYEKVRGLALAPILALHKKECQPDCPWNGQTIFP